jgi:hypothetical protein
MEHVVYHLQHMTALDQHRAIEEHNRNNGMLRGATVGVHTHTHTHTHKYTHMHTLTYSQASW